jgi:hypothetical protein
MLLQRRRGAGVGMLKSGEVAVKDTIVDFLSKLVNISTTNLVLIVVLVALLIVWRVVGKM